MVNSMAYEKNRRGGCYFATKKAETLRKDRIQSTATKTERRRIETEVKEREEKKRKQRITTACRKECIDPPNIMKKQGKNKQTFKHCSFRCFIHFIYTHFLRCFPALSAWVERKKNQPKLSSNNDESRNAYNKLKHFIWMYYVLMARAYGFGLHLEMNNTTPTIQKKKTYAKMRLTSGMALLLLHFIFLNTHLQNICWKEERKNTHRTPTNTLCLS